MLAVIGNLTEKKMFTLFMTLLNRASSKDMTSTPPPAKGSLESASPSVVRKLDWILESTGCAPKKEKKKRETYSKPNSMKTKMEMLATERKDKCTGLLGLRVRDSVLDNNDSRKKSAHSRRGCCEVCGKERMLFSLVAKPTCA